MTNRYEWAYLLAMCLACVYGHICQVNSRSHTLVYTLFWQGHRTGCRPLSPIKAAAARLSAAALTHSAMKEGPAALWPFEGEASAAQAQTWEELHTACGEEWPEQERDILEGHKQGSVAKARSTVSRTVAKDAFS
jgi:hypothetical protein